jgi:fatty-acyl-CoA synthase
MGALTGSGSAVSSKLPVSTLGAAIELGADKPSGLTFVDGALEERPIGYDELLDAIDRSAAGLRERELEPGDRVCLVAPTSPELVAVLLGAWRAGLVPTMMSLPRSADTTAWLESLAERARVAGASAIITAAAFRDMIAPTAAAVRTLAFEDLMSADRRIPEPFEAAPDDVAYLQFTSGSTGTSRAVALSHSQILWNVFEDVHTVALEEMDGRVSWLPLYHDFGLIFLLAAVFTGSRLVIQPTEQYLQRPGSWMDACSRFEATATAGPNSAYGLAARELALNPRDLDLSHLRVCLNGSEPVHAETVEKFIEAAARHGMPDTAPCAWYGLAESTLAVSGKRPPDPVTFVTVAREGLGERGARVRQAEPSEDGARRFVGCGTPDGETELMIVGEEGEPLPHWHVGEIAVRGPSVMVGYWGDEEATAETLRDGWLYTGDLGFLTGEGELVPCGRIKDMIIAGGRNLYPEEYEFIAERVDGVRKGNAVAFSLPELERMVVVAETKKPAEEAEQLARQVFARLREELDPPPSDVAVVTPGTVPKTSSGKRQRGLCRKRYLAGELEVLASAKR